MANVSCIAKEELTRIREHLIFSSVSILVYISRTFSTCVLAKRAGLHNQVRQAGRTITCVGDYLLHYIEKDQLTLPSQRYLGDTRYPVIPIILGVRSLDSRDPTLGASSTYRLQCHPFSRILGKEGNRLIKVGRYLPT